MNLLKRYLLASSLMFVVSLTHQSMAASGAVPSEMPPFDQELDMHIDAVMQRLQLDSKGLTPTVKEFEKEWVASLFTRGEPSVYGAEGFDYIGMPIGGLTSGQLYLGGDGKLWYWDIFNTRPNGVRNQRYESPEKQFSPVEQGFAIRTSVNGNTQVRTLDRHGFSDVSFLGQYPIGYCTFKDADSPVSVELEAFSPFIPLNLDDSSFPATVMQYTIKNLSDQPVDVALGGWLQNACSESAAFNQTGEQSNEIADCADTSACCPGAASCPPSTEGPGKQPKANVGMSINAIENSSGGMFLKMVSQPVLKSSSDAAGTRRPDIVFEDFESGSFNKWTVAGDVFGTAGEALVPVAQAKDGEDLQGYKGEYMADAYTKRGVGQLTSNPFKISRKSIHFLVGGDRGEESSIRLVVDGKIERMTMGSNREGILEPRGWDVSDLAGKSAVLEIVDNSFFKIMVDQIVFSDQPAPMVPFEQQLDYGSMALTLMGKEKGNFGNARVAPESLPNGLFEETVSETETVDHAKGNEIIGAVGRKVSLQPGESKTITFVVSWYFPNSQIQNLKTDTTRWYATQFKSAWDVSATLIKNFEPLSSQTRRWKETWYDSTLPYWFLDRTFLNTSSLATETCFRFADNRFYAMEGVYCCPGTCTHVWGYVQATGRLFPELEKSLREKVDYKEGIGFNRDTGAIAYRGEVQNKPAAVDGQAGVILRTYREHQMSVDDAFLKRNYSYAKKAMNYLIDTNDSNQDGILEGAQNNTLDAAWYGQVTWLSLNYCAALRATECMALDMGDKDYARKVRMIADRGGVNIAEQLYNGEYFIHKPDPAHPESAGSFNGSEYGQLFGQGWAYQVGLGRIIDTDKNKRALRSLWRYNFTTDVGPFREKNPNGRWFAMPGEGGLIACTFPHGGSDVLSRGEAHRSGYMNESQNGYEYGATSVMLWEGMVDYALAHTRTLHDRYHPSLRNPWNEIECGQHYARSMASYGLFTAICGFEVHGPKKYIAFSPRITPEDFRAPFTSAAGWGTFAQQRSDNVQTEQLTLRWGQLTVQQMAFDIPAGKCAGKVQVALNGTVIDCDFEMKENRVVLSLREAVTIKADQALDITIEF